VAKAIERLPIKPEALSSNLSAAKKKKKKKKRERGRASLPRPSYRYKNSDLEHCQSKGMVGCETDIKPSPNP
jgi:hypothetical protein